MLQRMLVVTTPFLLHGILSSYPPNQPTNQTMHHSAILQAICLLLLASVASAQFQFFDQFFGGQQQQQQQQQSQGHQDNPSDSSWYKQTWESCKILSRPRECLDTSLRTLLCIKANKYDVYSAMLELFMSRNAGLRALPAPLSVSIRGGGR